MKLNALLLVSTIFFVSCGSDSSSNNEDPAEITLVGDVEQSILGKWESQELSNTTDDGEIEIKVKAILSLSENEFSLTSNCSFPCGRKPFGSIGYR